MIWLAAVLLLIGAARHLLTASMPDLALQIWDISAALSIVVCLVAVSYLTKSRALIAVAIWWCFEEFLTIYCGTLDILFPVGTAESMCSGHVGWSFAPISLGAVSGIALYLHKSCKNQT
jgi:hypothetical protein